MGVPLSTLPPTWDNRDCQLGHIVVGGVEKAAGSPCLGAVLGLCSLLGVRDEVPCQACAQQQRPSRQGWS